MIFFRGRGLIPGVDTGATWRVHVHKVLIRRRVWQAETGKIRVFFFAKEQKKKNFFFAKKKQKTSFCLAPA